MLLALAKGRARRLLVAAGDDGVEVPFDQGSGLPVLADGAECPAPAAA